MVVILMPQRYENRSRGSDAGSKGVKNKIEEVSKRIEPT
jgi:hypothetical protein